MAVKPCVFQVDSKFYVHLEFEEGYSEKVYFDSGGAPTIGIGHLLTKSERASGKIIIDGVPARYAAGLSKEQIRRLAAQDVKTAVECVLRSVKAYMSQNQFNALVSLAYNIGETAFAQSTLVRKLNAGDYASVPAQMRRWIYDNGKEDKVLKARREREIALWLAE